MKPFSALHPRNQPWITRASYRREIVTAATLPIAVALIEGGVAGILANKLFHAPDYLFAAIMAAPMFANLTSFVWTRLAAGRRKVQTIALIQAVMLLGIASVALLPINFAGAVGLTVIVIACRCLLAGIITLRSTIWRQNYPDEVRGRVTGKLALIAMLMIVVAATLASRLLDQNDWLFRVIYPAAAAVAVIGTLSFARVRLRRERELLIYERTTQQAARRDRPSMVSVFRNDRRYRWYLTWQFCAGTAMMAGEAAIVLVIATLTRDRPFEYGISIGLALVLPLLLAAATLPLWSRLLDSVSIVEFRWRQAIFWVLAQVLQWLGAWTGSLWIIGLGRCIIGIQRGGGALAWQIGHNEFADRRLVPVYMGLHVTLTGLRGAIMPFLGVALLRGWDPHDFRWLTDPLGLPAMLLPAIPAWDGIGPHVFGFTTLMACVAFAGYFGMWWRERPTPV